jgi:predicted transcriptional regulator
LGKNRDRLSIVAAILEVANSGAGKTRIMFGANLSFKLLEKYLGVVVGAGLVGVEGSKFVLTEYGQEFLERYKAYNERYVGAEKLLEALDCERGTLDLMCGTSVVPVLSAAECVRQKCFEFPRFKLLFLMHFDSCFGGYMCFVCS